MNILPAFILLTSGLYFYLCNASTWLSWNIDGSSVEMTQDKIKYVQDNLGSKKDNLFKEVLHRVDNFVIPGYGSIYWAWHSGICNGLEDTIWKPSNGRDLGSIIGNEVRRLVSSKSIREGGVSIDIGAHTGDSTIPMAILSNMTIAFDPGSSVFPILEANALINPDRNIHVHNVAVGDHDGEIKFQYGNGEKFECNGGLAGVEGRYQQNSWVTKKLINFESFLLKNYGESIIKRISYIKTDVEGNDSHLLLLIITIIEKYQIYPVIQVEWFQPFSRGEGKSGILPPGGSTHLFQAIYRLIKKYRYIAYCTSQCNSPRHPCYYQTHKLLVTKLNGTLSVTCVEDGIIGSDKCEDILLMPRRKIR